MSVRTKVVNSSLISTIQIDPLEERIAYDVDVDVDDLITLLLLQMEREDTDTSRIPAGISGYV